MRSARWLALCVLPIALSACTKKDSPTSSTGTTSTSCTTKYSATVNGASWCALTSLSNYYPNQQQVVITGIGISSNGTWSLTVSASAITAAGTYPLNTLSPLRWGLGSSGATTSYGTNNAGSTGTITFTTFTTTHVVGTFSFNALPNAGSTGALAVTNGSFDVTLIPGS